MSTKPVRIIFTLVRVALWITPSHRKDWAQAMLNEFVYIESRRKAVRWIAESMLFVIQERTTYELEKVSMNIITIKAALVLAFVINTAILGFVAGIYSIQKPYQQERIKFALCRFLDVKQS